MGSVIPLKLNPVTGEIQQFQQGDTAGVAFGGLGQKFKGSVPRQSGTTTIPYGNSAPLSTAGTLLWSQAITPTQIGNDIHICFDTMIDTSNINTVVTIAIFAGTRLVGFKCAGSTAYNGNTPCPISIDIYDPVTSLVPVTYSCRIGVSGNTWYLGQGKSATMGGNNSSWWSIQEEA